MKRERVLAVLEPSYVIKAETLAQGEDVVPLLVTEGPAGIAVAALALPREQWDEAVITVARQARATAVFLISDARYREYPVVDGVTFIHRAGGLAADPEHVEAMVCTGVDLAGATHVIRPYRVEAGHLTWDEPKVWEGATGYVPDLLSLALLAAQRPTETGAP